MKILGPKTEPGTRAFTRTHRPRHGAYDTYRPCLRWDFGFTCAFCLMHEADLVEYGVAGWGLVWIEHFVPQSVDRQRINDYANCYLSCRFCNEARNDAPNSDGAGRRLLDPCREAWAAHFERSGDSLSPRQGDGNAAYTWETYDLDDDRKKAMRRIREIRLAEILKILGGGPERLRRLMDLAERMSGADREFVLREAEHLDQVLRQKRRELARYRAVPTDKDESCRCSGRQQFDLPQHLATQYLDWPFS